MVKSQVLGKATRSNSFIIIDSSPVGGRGVKRLFVRSCHHAERKAVVAFFIFFQVQKGMFAGLPPTSYNVLVK